MLRTRLITAGIVLPLVIASIIWLPTTALAAMFGVLLAIAAWEWSGLMTLSAKMARAMFVIINICAFAACWYPEWRSSIAGYLEPLAVVWWVSALLLIWRLPQGCKLKTAWHIPGGALGVLILSAAFTALVKLHANPNGIFLVLFLLVLIWAADTGAYFAGHAWGRHKLAPQISPGKSWEGALGGIVLTLIVAALGGWLLELAGTQLVAIILLGGATAGISIVGDLVFSMCKRQVGVKDSGSIFPGHGGVLDRLDSLFAAAPVFVFGWQWIAG